MQIKRLLVILFAGFSVLGQLAGQDIHFTQYNLAPVALNPAMQGNFSGTARISGIYRSQWQSVLSSARFQTPGLAVDAPIIRGFRRRDWVGVGAQFIGDRAGSLPMKRSIFAIGATYHLAFNRAQTTYLSIGGQFANESRKVGDGYRLEDMITSPGGVSMDPFAGQFQGQGPDFEAQGDARDYNAGISLTTRLNAKMDMQIGFAMFHLLQENASVASNPGFKFPRRSVLHGTFNIDLADRWTLSPSFFYQSMSANSEIALQSMVGYDFDPVRDITLNFGVGYRLGRDIQALIGAQYKSLSVGFAYDINTSDLNQETNYRGGFEIAAAYIFRVYKPSKIKPKILCPRF